MPTRRFHDNATAGDPFFASWVPGTRDDEAYLVAASRDGREGSFWKMTVAPVALKRHSHSVGGHGMELRTVIAGSATQATSDVLGSRNGWRISVGAMESGSGTIIFGRRGSGVPFADIQASATNLASGTLESRSYRTVGLPAVGFMVRRFQNGFLNCGVSLCMGNYGALFEFKSRRVIGPN